LTGGVTPAVRALEAAGVAFSLHPYRHEPGAGGYGEEAATALGLDPDRVFKTLLVTGDAGPMIAVVPVNRRLSLKALAAALEVKRVEMCDPAEAQRITGYVVGGISPFGQRRPLPTVIDESCASYDVIYVSGGRRGLDVGLAPGDLIQLLGAVTAPIAS
jgi:Cys-tRNA(Pro)/Cys-tRNA(Cys) deacylase